MKVLMSPGIAARTTTVNSKRYPSPKIIKELSTSRREEEGDAVAERLQGKLHSSAKRIAREEMALISLMIKRSVAAGEDKEAMSDQLARSSALETTKFLIW